MGLDLVHLDVIRVRCERLEIIAIRREQGSARLSVGDHECVNRRTSTSLPAKQRSSPRERFGSLLHDVARLEKSICLRVTPRMTLKTLDENDGGDDRRPQSLLPERKDQRCRMPRPFSKSAHSARVEDEHDGYPALRTGRRASRRTTTAARAC